MSLELFNTYVDGYTDHMFNLQLIGIQQGFYAGYYSRAKKPKKLNELIKMLVKNKDKKVKGTASAPDVDVEAFLEQERRFKEKSNMIK